MNPYAWHPDSDDESEHGTLLEPTLDDGYIVLDPHVTYDAAVAAHGDVKRLTGDEPVTLDAGGVWRIG